MDGGVGEDSQPTIVFLSPKCAHFICKLLVFTLDLVIDGLRRASFIFQLLYDGTRFVVVAPDFPDLFERLPNFPLFAWIYLLCS